jgi:L-idonate 5-dehydrogenase
MKAVVIHKAKDLRVEEVADTAPGPGEVAVAIKRGGICGSDLHYYRHGGFGTIVLKEPMVLGHEIAGEIAALGQGVSTLHVGQRVAVNPSLPCGICMYCQKAQQNHCVDMRFYGSAMRMPHIQGAFRQHLITKASQCHVIASDITLEDAAFAEPFAVALHAIVRAGSLAGKRLLVTGCGPIGVLAIAAANFHGAQEIVATDVSGFTLATAQHMGAARTVNVASKLDGMSEFKANKGYFDVMIEASGNESALRTGLECLKPRGTLLQLGLGGDISIPQNMIVSKEIEMRGSFRFHEEFALAIDLINSRRVNFKPLLTAVIPMVDAVKAFDLALDRSRAMKVQLAF